MTKINFPYLGTIYTPILKNFFEELDIDTFTIPITQKTIKLGVRHSADMICFPFKVTLGSFIQALDEGATDLLMFDTQGPCRFKHYHYIQKQILERLGYKFNMHVINKNVLFSMKKLNKKNSYYKITKNIIKCYKLMQQKEKEWLLQKQTNHIKLGVVGELYTVLEDTINYNIVEKLKGMNVNVDVSVLLSKFFKHGFFNFEHLKEQKEAKKYIKGEVAGHGFNSVYNSLYYAKNNYDGIIHLLPLSCMPESTVETLIDMISEEYDIPVYRFPIDDDVFQTGFDMRIKSIIRILERNKK